MTTSARREEQTMQRKDSSAQRDANRRLAAEVSEWAEKTRPWVEEIRRKTATAQGAPVGGRIVGDAAGRGEIPGRAIEQPAGRPRVPREEAARGRPSTWSQADETMDQTYEVIAASTVLAHATGRPEVDLREILRDQIAREMAGDCPDFSTALLRAKRQVLADVQARLR
jgi:hypothetical protein